MGFYKTQQNSNNIILYFFAFGWEFNYQNAHQKHEKIEQQCGKLQ